MLNTALYERTHILLGDAKLGALQRTSVFLAGAGGVGGHCAETLVRAGVGAITIVDYDTITASNKNRQVIALDSTLGRTKVVELARRLRDINADCRIIAMDAFIMPEEAMELLQRQHYDFVVDCIDSVECKVALLAAAVSLNLRVYSSCGAGGRLDPAQIRVGDVFDTTNDRLARRCRAQLRRRGVTRGSVTVVHSLEKGLPPLPPQPTAAGGRDRAMNGTISYMPALFGITLAATVLRCAVNTAAHDAAVATAENRARKHAHKRAKRERRASAMKAVAIAAGKD